MGQKADAKETAAVKVSPGRLNVLGKAFPEGWCSEALRPFGSA